MSRKVVLCAGHMIDRPDRAVPRFPPVKEEAVRAAMAEKLDRFKVGRHDLGVCGGARGADLLFAELCLERGARVMLVLPREREAFVDGSVRLPGSNWEHRFRRLLEAPAAERVEVREPETPPAAGENVYAHNNRQLLAAARDEAGRDRNLRALFVWDGELGDGPGGTGDLAALAAPHVEGRRLTVDPTDVDPLERDVHLFGPGPKRILTLDGGGVRGVLTLQFLARLEGQLRRRHDQEDLRLGQYFDLIAGTSTGAIIAAGLAIGMEVAEIEERYWSLAGRVFRRRASLGFLRSKFGSRALDRALNEIFGDVTLGGPELITGLLVVTKNMQSASQWPLSNNPRARYFHCRPGQTAIPNGRYLLRQVVRASTAAPHYFAPQPINVHPGVSRLFIDGGASTANNPALEALKLATLEGFGLGWPVGRDELLIVSCGTGRCPPKAPSRIAAFHAVRALEAILADCAELVETLMQWLSDGPSRRLIDRDLGDLAGDHLADRPLFTYVRYDTSLEPTAVADRLGVRERAARKLAALDRPRSMPLLAKLGQLEAERLEVEIPRGFDLR